MNGVRRMSLARLTATTRPGSRDGSWTWPNEHDDLWARKPDTMAALAADIAAHGLQEPATTADSGTATTASAR